MTLPLSLEDLLMARSDATATERPSFRPQRTIRATPTKGYSSGHQVRKPSTLEQALGLAAEIAPGSGEGLAAGEAIKEAGRGNYGRAALAAIGAVPVLGRVGKVAGKAKRVYHGTGEVFDEFDDSRIRTLGHWFTENPKQASSHAFGSAPNVRMARLDLQNPINLDAPISDGEMDLLMSEVRSLKPDAERAVRKDIEFHGGTWAGALTSLRGRLGNGAEREIAQRMGYDGASRSDGALIAFRSADILPPFDP